METCVTRRVSAFVLVVAAAVMGVPLPASSAGQEDVVVAARPGLTLNGQPLAELVRAPSAGRDHLPPVSLSEPASGQLIGVALDEAGEPIAGEPVQLRHIGPSSEVMAQTVTDLNGRFSFSALGRGRYAVDLRVNGHVAETSGPVALAAGGMTFIQLGGAPTRRSPGDEEKGRNAGYWTALGAGVGGALGVLSNAGVNCDLQENLCPVRSLGGVAFGALAGLMIGSAR